MRSINVAFVLLALTVASQAAPLEETNVPSLQDSRDVYIKKDAFGITARQEPEEEETENEGDIPSFTSARNTNDTPSRTTEESLAHLPTSSSHSDPQSGCHCPPLWPYQRPTPRDDAHHDFMPARCNCGSPPPPTITPGPHRFPGTIISRDIELEARKFPFKLIWNGFKWVMQEIGDAGGDDPTIQTVDTPKTMIDDSQLGAAASGNASAKKF